MRKETNKYIGGIGRVQTPSGTLPLVSSSVVSAGDGKVSNANEPSEVLPLFVFCKYDPK